MPRRRDSLLSNLNTVAFREERPVARLVHSRALPTPSGSPAVTRSPVPSCLARQGWTEAHTHRLLWLLVFLMAVAACHKPQVRTPEPTKPQPVAVSEVAKAVTVETPSAIEGDTAAIREETKGARTNLQEVERNVPEVVKLPEWLSLPPRMDRIDSHTVALDEHAKALRDMAGAFSGIEAGVKAWQAYAEAQAAIAKEAKAGEAQAVKRAEGLAEDLKAEKSWSNRLLKVIGGLAQVAGVGLIGFGIWVAISGGFRAGLFFFTVGPLLVGSGATLVWVANNQVIVVCVTVGLLVIAGGWMFLRNYLADRAKERAAADAEAKTAALNAIVPVVEAADPDGKTLKPEIAKAAGDELPLVKRTILGVKDALREAA